MTGLQLYLLLGVPILFNTALFTLFTTSTNKRLEDLRSHVDARAGTTDSNINARFSSLETRFEILTGKVAEFTDRVTRLEVKSER